MNLGIICEFNPFHQGHKYLIDSVKKEGDGVLCAMSGSFVQRGEPAVYDKFRRTEASLDGGADLVIELPSRFATRSAQGFAAAGVALLEASGICDALAFGAECDDTNALLALAKEAQAREGEILEEMKKGITYPQARQNVLSSPLLMTPNNILALEYLRFTKLTPIAVKRIGSGHDSGDALYSASEIRRHLPSGETARLENAERAVLYALRSITPEALAKIEDVGEGLENRIPEAAAQATTLEELYSMIKTKRYTLARIRRILLRVFLGLQENEDTAPAYLRILGFNAKGREMLGEMKERASLPLITRYADAKKAGGKVLEQYEEECRLTSLHALCYERPRPSNLDKTAKLIVKD